MTANTTVREKLNETKLGVGIAVGFVVIVCAIVIYLLWPAHRIDVTHFYYSDDDGQTYFKDSSYKFPPFDHDGRQAVQAVVLTDHGSKFVGYLIRYTPQAQKKLKDEYNDAVSRNLSGKELQHEVLTFMHRPDIMMGGQEVKLPGANNHWMPRSAFITTMIKTPSGDLPDGEVTP